MHQNGEPGRKAPSPSDTSLRIHPDTIRSQFERGVVVLSIDTEEMWGYADLMTESQYRARFPDAYYVHDQLLERFCSAGVGATWFVVGGLLLERSAGARDSRMSGLPEHWVARVPAGSEATAPLWYRKTFVEGLRTASTPQEIGLHGGLTHLIWTQPGVTRSVAEWELAEGIKALQRARVRPCSFSFGRNEEAFYDLLPAHGIRVFRGRSPALAWQLGPTWSGTAMRIADELLRATPPPVWPQELVPGLWNIPSSEFLYPIGPGRTRVLGLQSRVDRFCKGLEAAARSHGIFHYSLHPENLAESPHGFALLDEMLERLTSMRTWGDIEILTLSDVIARLERNREVPAAAPTSVYSRKVARIHASRPYVMQPRTCVHRRPAVWRSLLEEQ